MHLERLSDKNCYLFDGAIRLYESAFPIEERRDMDELNRMLKKEDYHVDFIMDGDKFQGVMLYWETEKFIYLEHFTTLPEVRNHGVGARALDLLKAKGKTILLEIEPPIDQITTRRYAFYSRNGFIMNEHHHIQAKYHVGDDDLELKIMSYPKAVPHEEYLQFQQYMTQEIGILPQFNDQIVIRQLSAEDDLLQVAKLIYLSDEYIYPYWFDDIEDGKKVIAEMIKLPTIYKKENVTVAVMPNGDIAGALVSCKCPFVEDEEHIKEAFARADVPVDDRLHVIYKSYYEKMQEADQGLYVSNVAVDPKYRKRGIATSLLAQVIKDHEFCHLECVQKNIGAWRVYQRLGFEIVEEYPGVFDVPCYKMEYRLKG